jgi:hypothetical protein
MFDRFARSAVASVVLLAFPSITVAQHGGGAEPTSNVAPQEATQFDFLVGQWDLIVKPTVNTLAAKIHGAPKMLGTWKAWRALDGWGVEDELRITDAAGNPRSLSHAVRFYDATSRRWRTSGLEVYRGVFSNSTAEWKAGTMTTMGAGTDGDGKAYVSRTRYTDITGTSFKFRQERSYDSGTTWEETLQIEAKRVAAAAPR